MRFECCDVISASLILRLRYGNDRFTYAERSMLLGRIRYLARKRKRDGVYAKPVTVVEDLYPPGFKPSGNGLSPIRDIMYADNPFLSMLPKTRFL